MIIEGNIFEALLIGTEFRSLLQTIYDL